MSNEVQFDDREFQTRLADYLRRAPEAARKAMVDAGEHILSVAQARCPVKTGALQASGTLEDRSILDEVIIGFNTNYAAPVHERLDAHHTQGQAKFLESAVKEKIPYVAAKIGEELQRIT